MALKQYCPSRLELIYSFLLFFLIISLFFPTQLFGKMLFISIKKKEREKEKRGDSNLGSGAH